MMDDLTFLFGVACGLYLALFLLAIKLYVIAKEKKKVMDDG